MADIIAVYLCAAHKFNTGKRIILELNKTIMKSKTTAALLAFFLGGLGAHHFYLGKKAKGFIYLFMFLFAFPLMLVMGIGFLLFGLVGLFSLMDFIYLLAMDEHKFNNEFNSGIQSASISTADEIQKLHNLKVAGVLTQEEFEKKKSQLI